MLLNGLLLLGCSQQEAYTVTVGTNKKKGPSSVLDTGPSSDDDNDIDPEVSDQTDPAPEPSEPSNEETPSNTDAPPEAKPDFILQDINPTSSTFSNDISPRDYLNEVSGWYFIRST